MNIEDYSGERWSLVDQEWTVRVRKSRMSIGAPQCRQTKVDRGEMLEAVAVFGSTGLRLAGASSSARAAAMLFLRRALASRP